MHARRECAALGQKLGAKRSITGQKEGRKKAGQRKKERRKGGKKQEDAIAQNCNRCTRTSQANTLFFVDKTPTIPSLLAHRNLGAFGPETSLILDLFASGPFATLSGNATAK